MDTVRFLLRELVGLFIDDEFLAIAILIVVGLAALLAYAANAASLVIGAVLFLGCLGVLIASALRGAAKR